MNDYKRFALALLNNKINDYQNYIPVKSDNNKLYIKKKSNNKYYVIDVRGKQKIEEISEKEIYPSKSKPKSLFKRQYNPLYKNLEPRDTMNPDYYGKANVNENENKSNEDTGENIFNQKSEDQIPELGEVEKEDENTQKLGEKPPYEFDKEMKEELQKLKEEQDKKLEEEKKEKNTKKNSKNNSNKKKQEEKENNSQKKKKKRKPQGWHLKKEYVDDDGNVYFKGVEQPHLKGSKTPTSQREEK